MAGSWRRGSSERRAGAKVLYVSGYAAETIVVDEMAPDFFLLQKPYSFVDAGRRVQEVLAGAENCE